jgi:hypothetical protein
MEPDKPFVVEEKSTPVSLSPWPLLHGVLVAVMVASISLGLAPYISLWGALPVALAVSLLFSKLAERVTAPARAIGWIKRTLVAVVLLLLFALSGGLSYATIYTLLFAESNGTRFLDTQISQYKEKLGMAIGASTAFVNSMKSLEAHSAAMQKKEVETGASCPNYANSPRKPGPISGFRDNDAAIALRLKDQIAERATELKTAVGALPTQKPTNYNEAIGQSNSLNVAVRTFNTFRANPSLESIASSLAQVKDLKISGKFDCGDSTRQSLIEGAIKALNKVQQTAALAELRPGIDLEDKKAVTSRSLLRGITLVASVPPISWFAKALGINTSFDDDPLMRTELRAKGVLNFETLPLFVSGLLELTILLTARLAYGAASRAFDILKSSQIDSIRDSTGFLGVILRALANLVLIKTDAVDSDGPTTLTGAKTAFSHTPSDPQFEAREKQFATQLLPWVIELDWGSYLVIPDLKSCELDHHAAGVLVYESLAALVAQSVSWQDLHSIHYAMDRRGVEGRYGKSHEASSFHVYRLSEHFAQALRLELLKTSKKTGLGN